MASIIPQIPGVQFSDIKPYLHRKREYQKVRYHDHIDSDGDFHTHSRYNVIIKTSRAWRIGFKNVSNTTIDIVMDFSVHDKHGLLEHMQESYTNLRPGESAELYVAVRKKKHNLKLEGIGLYEHATQRFLSRTDIKRTLPRLQWGMRPWAVALIMLLFILIGFTDVGQLDGPTAMLPFFAFFIMMAGVFNITPVFTMLLVLLMIPFSLLEAGMKTTLTVMGLAYLYWVWNSRYSIKDFLWPINTPVIKER